MKTTREFSRSFVISGFLLDTIYKLAYIDMVYIYTQSKPLTISQIHIKTHHFNHKKTQGTHLARLYICIILIKGRA